MKWTPNLALVTGVLGPLAVLLFTVLGGAGHHGYSHVTQFISELGASGAPNARIINMAGFLPAGILLVAFSFFAWRSLPRSIPTTLGFLGLAVFAGGYIAAAFFPCEPGCRPARPDLSQVVHTLIGLCGYITAPLGVLALGWEARRWPGGTSLSALAFLVGGVALACLPFLSPDFPYVGAAQRILEGSILAWVAACGLQVGRSHNQLGSWTGEDDGPGL